MMRAKILYQNESPMFFEWLLVLVSVELMDYI